MDFSYTTHFIYQSCITRVQKELERKKLHQISIYPSDKTLVSTFFNYMKYIEKGKQLNAFLFQYYKLLTQFLISFSDIPFTILPVCHFAFGLSLLKTSTVLPIPLPPEVANGTIVLPDKS